MTRKAEVCRGTCRHEEGQQSPSSNPQGYIGELAAYVRAIFSLRIRRLQILPSVCGATEAEQYALWRCDEYVMEGQAGAECFSILQALVIARLRVQGSSIWAIELELLAEGPPACLTVTQKKK